MRLNRFLFEKRITLASKPETIMQGQDAMEDPEDYTEDQLFDAKEVSKLIKSKCKEFIRDSEGNILWRGYKSSAGSWYTGNVRGDRQPKDTPYEIHEALDEEFEDQFGWRCRSESIFTTGNKGMAQGYGPAYSVWPEDGYKFVWSEDISDLYQELDVDNLMGALSGDTGQWEGEWEEEYGEDQDGEWSYDGDDTNQSYRGDAEDWVIEKLRLEWENDHSEQIEKYQEMEQEEVDSDEWNELKQWFDNRFEDFEDFDAENKDFGDEYEPDLLEWDPAMELDDYIQEKQDEAQEALDDAIGNVTNSYQDTNMVDAISSGNEVMVGPANQPYILVSKEISGLVWEYVHGIRGADDTKQMKFDFNWKPNAKTDKGVYQGNRFCIGAFNQKTKNIEYIATWRYVAQVKGFFRNGKNTNGRDMSIDQSKVFPRQLAARLKTGETVVFFIPFDTKNWNDIYFQAAFDAPGMADRKLKGGYSSVPSNVKDIWRRFISLKIKLVT